MRALFPYLGGKQRLAPWAISHMPEHDTYVEAFAGAASVFWRKPKAKRNVLNDTNAPLMNFYRWLRDDVAALEADVRKHDYTRERSDETRKWFFDWRAG